MSDVTKVDWATARKLQPLAGFLPTHVVHLTMPLGHHQAILEQIIAARDWLEVNAPQGSFSQPPVYYFDNEDLALQFYLTFG